MALVEMNFESQYLCNNHVISIILPDKPRAVKPKDFYTSKKYPVLWLLHGTFGDHSDWLRKSNIELYACENDLIVVMPSAMNSNYASWPAFAMGYNMWDYLFEELMPLIYNWFPASDKREDNFIAGLSMGGGGTAKYAIYHPEKFAAAAILSSAPRNLEVAQAAEIEAYKKGVRALSADTPAMARVLNAIEREGGVEGYLASRENVWAKLKEYEGKPDSLPKLYVACGTNDKIAYPAFLKFKEYCEELGIPARFQAIEGYEHEWRFWDITIQNALSFFGFDNVKLGNPF